MLCKHNKIATIFSKLIDFLIQVFYYVCCKNGLCHFAMNIYYELSPCTFFDNAGYSGDYGKA